MPFDLMTLQEWKTATNGGFFARRKNPVLLAIDAELAKYHATPTESKQARYMGALGIFALCETWLKQKVEKKKSSRRFAVTLMKSAAQSTAAKLERELSEASARGGARWAMLRRIFVPQGKPGGAYKPAVHLDVKSSQPAYTAQTTGELNSVIEEIREVDALKTTTNAFLLEASNPDHIYSGAAGPAFQKWLDARRKYCLELADYLNRGSQGQAPKEPEPFFEWWRKNGGGKAGPDQYIDLQDVKSVQYLSAAERLDYQIHFSGGRLSWGPGGVDGPVNTMEWRTAVNGGADGFGIFVLSPEPRLYAGEQVEGQFHHSSFLSGGPVLAAGELKVRNGELLEVTNNSGHYKPDLLRHYNMLLFLDRNGVNLRRVLSKVQGQPAKDASVHLRDLTHLAAASSFVSILQTRVGIHP